MALNSRVVKQGYRHLVDHESRRDKSNWEQQRYLFWPSSGKTAQV
jgi:hypothetical protein